ncbi:FeoA family protein [Demequina aurantiaca]|uniref:FeoA family protein n=1 Tax=Demequina aurantiaca TaxID=676200 RepID=UPI003D335E78
MSAVSLHLSTRTIDSHDNPGCIGWKTLSSLAPGQRAVIVDVCDEADPATARRLFDLGFAPGSPIEVLRRAPMADPVVYRVSGYEIALRRAQARCIQVSLSV